MLRTLALFFILGLSVLVEQLGWTEQGTAFILIVLGMVTLITLAYLFAGNGVGKKLGLSLEFVRFCAFMLCITLFAAWVSTKILDVDFAVAFQLMSFGQCLCIDTKKE